MPARDSTHPTPEMLIARCADGDQNALKRLYEQKAPHLFGLLKRILDREDLAQDALQEVFVSIWRNASSYSERKGAAFTWMVSIARYRAIDIKRRRRFEVADEGAVDNAVDDENAATDPFLAASADADRDRLADCMMQLQTSARSAIGLAYLKGLSHSEVAERLGAPLGTVKSWIRRGLESLKGCLDR